MHLPGDYLERVKRFYAEGRKDDVEIYARELENLTRRERRFGEIRLIWDERRGLTNIGIGPGAGLDLEDNGIPRFAEHNLGSLNGQIAGAVAMKYVSELMKSGRVK